MKETKMNELLRTRSALVDEGLAQADLSDVPPLLRPFVRAGIDYLLRGESGPALSDLPEEAGENGRLLACLGEEIREPGGEELSVSRKELFAAVLFALRSGDEPEAVTAEIRSLLYYFYFDYMDRMTEEKSGLVARAFLSGRTEESAACRLFLDKAMKDRIRAVLDTEKHRKGENE